LSRDLLRRGCGCGYGAGRAQAFWCSLVDRASSASVRWSAKRLLRARSWRGRGTRSCRRRFDEQVDVCVAGDFSSLEPLFEERALGASPAREVFVAERAAELLVALGLGHQAGGECGLLTGDGSADEAAQVALEGPEISVGHERGAPSFSASMSTAAGEGHQR
jgi:hypothetical protein